MAGLSGLGRRILSWAIVPVEPHPCAYLPERTAREAVFALPVEDAIDYELLLRLGYRRAGAVFYRTACPACRACLPIRVPVRSFRPSRSQRRVRRRNRDLRVTLRRPRCDGERFELFRRHQDARFGRPMCSSPDELARTLFDSPIETVEMDYWLGRRLVGVGIVDVCPRALSSVYFFFDPDLSRRSLGIFSALTEIDLACQWGRRFWYAGYWVRDCRSMSYKSAFRPHELLTPSGWQLQQ